MAAITNLNGLSDSYQLYRLNVAEEVAREIEGAAVCSQDPPPEVHVQMSPLNRAFRDRYVKILITKEEVIPLSYDEDGQVDLTTIDETMSQIGWEETFAKMQQLVDTISEEGHPDQRGSPLYGRYLISRQLEIVQDNNALFGILEGRMRRPELSLPHAAVASAAAPVTSENAQEIPEELLLPIYSFLSMEDAAKCARVANAWNRTNKTQVREEAHQYAYGLKELETSLFEGLGPQAVCSDGGIPFRGMFRTLAGSDASSSAFFRSREMVKQELTINMTTRQSNFAIVQAALQAITNRAACSPVFKQDVADCISIIQARDAIWERGWAKGNDLAWHQSHYNEWAKETNQLMNNLIEDRVLHRHFGAAFGLAFHQNPNDVIRIHDAAVRKVFSVDPELAWRFANHYVPGRPNPQTLRWLADAIPDSHTQLKQQALRALPERAIVPPASEEDEHKEAPPAARNPRKKCQCVVS